MIVALLAITGLAAGCEQGTEASNAPVQNEGGKSFGCLGNCPDPSTAITADQEPLDQCMGGKKVCDDLNPCTDDGCDPASGCTNTPTNEGGACDDGNACTLGNICTLGVCGGTSVVCSAMDQCHDAGVCDTATGSCSNPAKPDNTGCSDGNACTMTDICMAGSCLPGPTTVCSATDQCHDAGVCDTATGSCSNPAK
ncbi:MAG: hypothetical protein AAB373_00860, partial [Patescibacteria group bacterium]